MDLDISVRIRFMSLSDSSKSSIFSSGSLSSSKYSLTNSIVSALKFSRLLQVYILSRLLSNRVLPVSTVKFDLKDDLEELQARLYLDTRKRLTKKEVLEIAFRVGLENYDLIVKEIRSKEKPLDDDVIQKVLSLTEDLGPGSEDLSSKVDEILYGGS